ncbi:hypothetical protein MJO28_007118 [Puccinia striiformis f. sp. tritici]|uniref:Uncharacterized protein n=1 Tax=Puccinia striiformis f. sp. tritici TaxID=168172 RepID=A0ACC0EF88_9BASI|nr:hypothetical protein MJO28_007118 [Puccinia striiformis f. sp. tritici]
MNNQNVPNHNPGPADKSQLQPTQRRGEPYEGIFFEETQVGGTVVPPVPNLEVPAAGAVNQATGMLAQTVPVLLVMANPVPDDEVAAMAGGSSPDKGSFITLDYCLYVSTYNHLTAGKSKAKNKSDSEKIVPPKNTMPSMRTNLHNRTWADLRAEIIRIIGGSRKHLDVYIARLLNERQIYFHFYIPNSHAFPFKRNYYVTSEAEYQAFLEELVRKPNSKIFIRMAMDEPGAKAKSQEVIKHQDDCLDIAVGSADEVVNLERLRARHDQNPHADMKGDPIAPWVVRLRVHLENRVNTRLSETIFIQDDEHPGLALRVTHERLWAWDQVLQQRTAGNVTAANEHVDLDHPPRGANWVWETRSSISPIKLEARRSGPSTPLPGPFGVPSATSATPPAIFGNRGGATLATPAGNPARPAATPLNSVGQPPDSAGSGQATPLNADIHPALVADDHLWIMNSLPSTIQGSAASSEIDFIAQDGSQVVVRRPSPQSESSIEYLDDASSNRIDCGVGVPGPSRKLARSPHGHAQFKGKGKCREFNRSVRDTPSPSPTRKRAPLPLAPLSEAGRRMTIMEFLIHCNIEEYDSMSHSLIDGHCIEHWCFFRGQTAADLMRIGFPRGLAAQIYHGVLELEVTMTTSSDSPPTPGPSNS